MIEFFTNHTQEFVFYSMYFPLVFYIFWIVSYQWLKNHYITGHGHRLFHFSIRFQKQTGHIRHQTNSSFIIHRLKTIRRKTCRGDDPDGPIFLLP